MTMTTNATYVGYTGDGVTTVFAIPFAFFGADELVAVTINSGVVTTLVRGVDYVITGGGGATGSLAITSLAAGVTLRIRRNTTKTQTVDYVDGDPFSAATHEAALDRRAMVDQDLTAAITRSLRALDHETLDMVLPAATVRGSNLLMFNADGTPTVIAASAVSATVTGALIAANNLSDLINAGIARKNLNQGVVTLSGAAASIATDCSLGNMFSAQLVSGTGPYTLANPTNIKAGATYIWQIKQPAAGSVQTLAYGGAFKFTSPYSAASPPALTATLGAVDFLSGVSFDGSTIYLGTGLNGA